MTEHGAIKERTNQADLGGGRPPSGRDGRFEQFMALQRLAGNSAVNTMIAKSGLAAPPRPPVPVQRFPSTVLTSPTKWSEYTADVERPGEGASGGIYILKSSEEDPAIPKVVVKPVFGENAAQVVESGAQITFGDRALKELFGINTPQSRSVAQGSAEFDELVELCGPKAPPKPTGGMAAEKWKGLDEAKSFVVMSMVPKGESLQGLVKGASKDPKALQQLHTALFADSFLTQLGKLCVGDMLIGNDDRINQRAMNLGNVMVSTGSEGGPELWAIDTNSVLGEYNPQDVLAFGSASGNLTGSMSTSGQLKLGPEQMLDRVFEYVVGALRKQPKTEGEDLQMTPADLVDLTYQSGHDKYVGSFAKGWREGLHAVQQLAESKPGRSRMKSITGRAKGEQGGENVRYLTMKLNAMYMAGRGRGDSHQETGQKTAAYAALKQLNETDPGSVRQPDDGYSWTTARVPGKEALSSQLTSIAALPPPTEIRDLVPNAKKFDHDQSKYEAMMASAQNAKDEVDQLGTKRRGAFKKADQTRNRVVAGRFVAEAYELAASGIRKVTAVKDVDQTVKRLEIAAHGRINPSLAPGAVAHAEVLAAYVPELRRDLGEYADQLRTAKSGVAQMSRYVLAPELAKALADIAGYANRGDKVLRTGPAANPRLFVNTFRAASSQ